MSKTRRILVTGATGKVGSAFLQRFLADPEYDAFAMRALYHNRLPEPHARVEIVRGSVAQHETVQRAM